MKIALIACCSRKRAQDAPARDMYISELFTKSYQYAKDKIKPDKVFILSAKYGLIPEDMVIHTYNETLNTKSIKERKAWADLVVSELRRLTNPDEDEYHILAGKKYSEFVIPHLKHTVNVFDGLQGIGYILQRLTVPHTTHTGNGTKRGRLI